MLRRHDRELRALLIAVEISLCGAIFALGVAFGVGSGGVTPSLALVGLVSALALPVSIRILDAELFSRLESLLAVVRQLVAAAAVAVLVVASTAFVTGAPIPPAPLVALVGLQVLVVGGLRLAVLSGLRLLRTTGRNFRNVLIVGTGPRARVLTETLRDHAQWGLKVLGYIDEGDVPVDPSIPAERVYKLSDFPRLIRDEVIDEVITACPRGMLASIGPVLEVCAATGVPLTVMTDLFGDYMPPPRVKQFASHAALSFAPVHHSRTKLLVKRGIDIAGSSIGLVIAAPIIAMAAGLIKSSSPGAVFFRQVRCGLNGRRFEMLKLRTMVADAEERRQEILHLNQMDGPVFKVDNDPRVTKVGRVLRAFSIDELPQLWNVLVGDMSLVGPRPPIPAEVVQYETADRRRLSMRPGLTCVWQVSGRNEIDFADWVKLDLDYIDSWSLSKDLKILAQTIPTVVRGAGH